MSLKYYKLSISLFILFYFLPNTVPVFPFGPIRLACLHDGGLLSWDEFGLVGWIFLGPNVVYCNHAALDFKRLFIGEAYHKEIRE